MACPTTVHIVIRENTVITRPKVMDFFTRLITFVVSALLVAFTLYNVLVMFLIRWFLSPCFFKFGNRDFAFVYVVVSSSIVSFSTLRPSSPTFFKHFNVRNGSMDLADPLQFRRHECCFAYFLFLDATLQVRQDLLATEKLRHFFVSFPTRVTWPKSTRKLNK